MIVDVHAHCYPKMYMDALKRMGKGDQGGIGIQIPEWASATERLEVMDMLGIDVQVLGLSAPNVYFEDSMLSKDLAQATNDFIAEVSKQNPGRFLSLASFPLTNLNHAFDELSRALDYLYMDGVLLGTNVNQIPLSDDRFLPLFQELDRRKVTVALHPMKATGEKWTTEEDVRLTIPSNVGFIFETTRTMAQLIFKGTLEKFQDLKFILPHSGGCIPFIYPRWDISYRSRPKSHPLRNLPHPPSYYLKKQYYDTALAYSHSSIRCTLDLAGVDHLLIGTDSPYTHDFRAKEAVESIETLGLTEEEKNRVSYKNAAELFPRLQAKIL